MLGYRSILRFEMLIPLLFAAIGGIAHAAIDTFTNVTVYDPGTNAQLINPRTAAVNNTILAVWDDPESPNGQLDVYRSTDDGYSWRRFSNVTSNQAGRRLIQPHMLYLNSEIGQDYAGTVIMAVNAIDAESTNIEIYTSWDSGETWEFEYRVATGGRPDPTSGDTPVWEPFLLQHGNLVTVFYSDQRDSQHSQKISQQTTRQYMDEWGSAIDVASFPDWYDRAGMSSVAALPNGQFIIVFEHGKLNSKDVYEYPIYYKISSSAENFASEPARQLLVSNGNSTQPHEGPFVTWSPLGGNNGTIVVSDSTSNAVYVNQALGQGAWKALDTPVGRAYSREVRVRK
jgi:hypothetical protein